VGPPPEANADVVKGITGGRSRKGK
jgi:hypothetical protein